MLLTTRGIVFRTIKYGETSVIADIFTEDKGLHTFIAGSVRTAKSRMPFNLFQPMMTIELVAYFKDSPHAMSRLKEIRACEVYTEIPFDIRKGAIALFMAEICRKSIQEVEENRGLFSFLVDNLRWLDTTREPIANLHLHFLLQLSGYLGFQPQPEDEERGELFFDLQEGTVGPHRPLHGPYMEPEATATMLALLEAPLEACHEVAITRVERKKLLNDLLRFYALHVPAFSDVHTPDILEMIM
jgi:DNA repair protein RecO (recombination protein O)